MLQTIGAYLDVALVFTMGLLATTIPEKLIGKKGTEEERNKKFKILKVVGPVMIILSILQLLFKFSD